MNLSSLLLVLSPCVLPITSGWSLGSFGESLFSLLDKLNKLVLTHSEKRLIKLSNNPSGKKVILLASRSLYTHRLNKFILLHKFEPQRCHYNLNLTDLGSSLKFIIDSHIILVVW